MRVDVCVCVCGGGGCRVDGGGEGGWGIVLAFNNSFARRFCNGCSVLQP